MASTFLSSLLLISFYFSDKPAEDQPEIPPPAENVDPILLEPSKLSQNANTEYRYNIFTTVVPNRLQF